MTSVDSYSRLDRFLHRTIFSSRALQFTAADMEKALYGKTFADVRSERPVFVCSLPRAGTTLVLELLVETGYFASHTYRDMPMVMAPVLWSRLSAGFQKKSEMRERAHGDGMQISVDSPEAFEEILWKAFWPKKFRGDRIELWARDERNRDFEEFFPEHMRRLIAVRSGPDRTGLRYLSKNNANIARVGLLRRLFPDCSIVLPFRDPLGQAESLLRQHLRFEAQHREDPFAKRYMRDIGHLEFGELHQPLAFDGVAEIRQRYGLDSLAYWLEYWSAAFRAVLAMDEEMSLVCYEKLCADPEPTLTALADRLGIDRGRLLAAAPHMRTPTLTSDVEAEAREPLETARALYDQLVSRSIG